MRSTFALLACAFCLAPAGCRSHYRTDRVVEIEGVPFEIVWRVAVETLRTEFPVRRRDADRGRKRIETGWRLRLMPFSKGRRSRAVVKIESLGPERHRILLHVDRQRYGDMATALRPQEDEWEDDGQDQAVEERLVYHLRARLARWRRDLRERG